MMVRPATCCECRDLATTDAAERRELGAPTSWWHCQQCRRHLNRYRGMTDQQCSCGAWYNAGGQRLRDNWYDNPSVHDDDVDDLEGYEQACLRAEARIS